MTTTHSPRCSRRVFLRVVAAVAAFAAPFTASRAADVAIANQPLQIWFVRHAESEINIPGNPRPVPDSGVSYPLTKKGVGQARALAEALADVPITMIYTSTHLRAVQTADALALRHDLTLNLAPEAVEIDFGIKDEGFADARAVYLDMSHKWAVDKDLEARHGEGESLAEVQRRFLPFVREIMIRQAHDSGVVVIVSHGGTLGLLVPTLATNVPADFGLRHPLPNTGIIKTELRDSKLFCTDWAGIPSAQFTAE